MTKGRHPELGRKLAVTAASQRGRVHIIDQGKDRVLDILITTSSQVILVTVGRSEHISEPVQKIEEEYRESVCRIRTIPDGGPVCRELWLYSRYKTLRFFRIVNHGIIELSADGNPLTTAPENAGMIHMDIPEISSQSA
ncbi:MAG TPA: hypothetical protein PKM50_00860 [Methanoregula sp.]|nr:hypothetical protein [Methanoregula sp.]